MKLLFTVILFIASFQFIDAQIIINEYSASNLNSYLDEFGKSEDWIELYNTGTTSVDLSGWHLSDKVDKPTKWAFPNGTSIGAGEYLVVLCSGRDGLFMGQLHSSFKLTQTKDNEFVQLADENGTIIQSFKLSLTLVEQSHCREIDGTGEWMICSNGTPGQSNAGPVRYSGFTATPSMDKEAGYYDNEVTVTLTNNEPNSTLRYTTNGRNVTSSSEIYADPITINETTVIKARAFSNDALIHPGKMDFNTYLIDEDYTLPVYSVAANDVIQLANGAGEIIPIGSIEYFNVDKEREATSFGSLNRHGQDSWALPHRSLDWISRDEMGYSKAVEAPLFNYSERDEYQRFMFRNSGDDNYPAVNDFDHQGSTHIRDEYVQQLALDGDLKLNTRSVERVVLFLNGQYWGVYGMREKIVDHDYTSEYFDQDKYDLQYLATWGSTEVEYGGQKALDDWYSIRDFVLENDMSIEANYQIVEDSINLVSLIDYMVVNLNVVASDWLNYNTGWWRGLNPDGDHKKWGYILWDLDATFDYYINYSGVPNTTPTADPCDIEDIAEFVDDFFEGGFGGELDDPADCPTFINGDVPYAVDDPLLAQIMTFAPNCCNGAWDQQCEDFYTFLEENSNGGGNGDPIEAFGNVGKHEQIYLKLIDESPIIQQLYYSRYADLMNTVFSCDNMLTTLDSMLATITPEMPGQINRWGGTLTEWEDNVEDLRAFITDRCSLLDDGLIECYEELSGPYPITLQTRPSAIGEIDFNTLDIESFPWTGEYFDGMDNLIKAKVFDEFEDLYEFSHWESTSGNVISPSITERKASIVVSQSDTLTAVFVATTSTEELTDLENIKVFPNPTDDIVNINIDLANSRQLVFTVTDVLGKNAISLPSLNDRYPQGKSQLSLKTSDFNLTKGVYLLNIKSVEEQVSKKIILLK